MTTYKYDKIIKSVEVQARYVSHYFGMGQEEQVICVTWTERKHRSRKVRPMLGDDYRVSEYYEVETKQILPFSQTVFDDLTSKIGKPRVVRHLPDVSDKD